MAATITGIIFNDLNHNGQYDTGEPGIPGVYVVLYSSAAGCVTTQTDANGIYSFTVITAGTYTIYEPVSSPSACPPSGFSQPDGFTMSNGPRKLTVTVTAAQVNNGSIITNQNFSHDTVDQPLICNTRMIQFVGQPTNWYNINIVTGQPASQGPLTPEHDVNAIGYNILDDYIYGYDQTTDNIVRVDNDGLLMQLPRPAGLPAANYNTGTFDLKGFFYIFVNNTSRFYTIDLRPDSSTFMKLVDPAAGYAEQTANFGTALSATTNISDWVYNPADGNLYGILRNGVLVRIAPATGQVTSLATTAPDPDASFGALAIDSTGTIYAIANDDGTIYKYTFSGNTAAGRAFSKTYFASFNDGTMCPTAAVLVDYGDAPDISSGTGQGNYNTLLANNGPRHELINKLTLGTQVTAETDAHQNSTATGDDLTKGIQDDGLDEPLMPLSLSMSTYTLPVTVTNETGAEANLYGWIDFNQNGLFEFDEAAPVVSVPSFAGAQTVELTFTKPAGAALVTGDTFVRLRLTTDTLTNTEDMQDSRSVGPASDGEVEDYILSVTAVADLAVDKTADLQAVIAGDLITYTIKITNYGPDPATDSVLTDILPDSVLNQQYSLDGGNTWLPWPGILYLGTLDPGFVIPVLVRGIYDGSETGSIVNMAEVTTTATDPDFGNNSSTVITPIIPSADLSVTKEAEQSQVTAGEMLVYRLHVFNNGPNTAQEVLLVDEIPAEILNPEYSVDGGITYNPWNSPYFLGDLPGGAGVDILIRGIAAPFVMGTIVNTATVSSITPDPDLSNNKDAVETLVNALADISVVKLGTPNPAEPGAYLTYTLVISNAGPSAAEEVVLTDFVPDALGDVEFSFDNGISFQPWSGFYLIGHLPAGEVRTVLLRGIVSPSATGTITNTAAVESITPDPDPGNNSSTEDTPVNANADLMVSKTGEPSPVSAGGELTFTILITNNGPSDGENVILYDDISPQLTAVEYSLDGGSNFYPWNGSAGLGTLPAGASQTVVIRGHVIETATGVITNTAIVSSTTPDPDPDNNQDTVIIPIETSADLMVTKLSTPNPAIPGQQLIYSVTVRNNGPDPAVNAILTDMIPSELDGAEYSIDGGNNWFTWTGSLVIGTLASGASRTVLIRGTVRPGAAGSIVNTASVSSDTPDPNPDNNEDTAITPVNESADVFVRKDASPAPVRAGELLTYTITVSNDGPNAAQEVTLTDVIPAEIINPEFAVQGSGNFSPWMSPYRIGTLAAGDSYIITLRGTVRSSMTNGSILNTAAVSSSTPDPDPDNNTDTVETPVKTLADIAVVKNADISPAVPGQPFSYTITVTNAGPSDAQNVTLIDAVPAELLDPEFSVDDGISYSSWSSPYHLGILAAGTRQRILIRGTLSSSARGEITNNAVVGSTTADPNPDNNTATDITPVQPSADISVVKTGTPNPVPAGGRITYTVIISNAGPSVAENVVLSDVLPVGLGNGQISRDGGLTWAAFNGSYRVGNMEAGTAQTYLIRADVAASAPQNLTNTAVVTSDTPDPDPDNNSSTTVTPVIPSADLSVSKTGSPNPVQPGELLNYRIIISNDGPADALNVVLRDEVPNVLTDVQFSLDNGLTWQTWMSSYNLGTVAAGENFVILIRGAVDPSASGSIINTAVVTSTTPDPDPGNNTDTAEIPVRAGADLCISKCAYPETAIRCQYLTYVLTVFNGGPEDAEQVVIVDNLSCQLEQPIFSLDCGANWYPWNGSYTFANLPDGDCFTIWIAGIVSQCAEGTIENTATVSSSTPDPNPLNNTACVTVCVC